MFPTGSVQQETNGLVVRKGVGAMSALMIPRNPRENLEMFLKDFFHESRFFNNFPQDSVAVHNGPISLQNGIGIAEKQWEPSLGTRDHGSLPVSFDLPVHKMSPKAAEPLTLHESGSTGSSSRGSDKAMGTLASNSKIQNVKQYDLAGREMASNGIIGKCKKKRIRRSTLGLKGSKGLRHFSMKVCKKVESKGWTTYNEVASELVSEIVNGNNSQSSQDQQDYDEKNIRRRVYDALNVLMAMDIISKEKKEIQWKGLPTTNLNDIEQLQTNKKEIMSRIEKKRAYIEELEEQRAGLQRLMSRNEKANQTGNNPSGSVALPFILVKTRPHATVDIEISEDMQLVHFDFNSTPFELHDDASILKAMELSKKCENASTTGGKKIEKGSLLEQKHFPFSHAFEGVSPSVSARTSDIDSYSLSSIPGRIFSSTLC